MELADYDLWYDANSVGGDLVVETWISHGPRALDPGFDPQPGDWLTIGDDEEPPVRSRVVRRDGNRVWVQLDLSHLFAATSGTAAHT
jgi:hypothetical protein